jgi:O-antigen/teichoic acid export membrane protein
MSQEAKTLSKRGNLLLVFSTVTNLLSGKVARQGYLAAVDQGVISLANFSATIILARKISPTELGVYGVGFIALRLTRSLQEGLVVQPMNVFGAGMDAPDFKRYATSSGLIQAGLALATSLAAAVGGWILTALGNDTAGPVLFALWFAFLSWQMQEYIRRLMYTRGDVFLALVNTILANGIRLGLMIWWASTNGLNGIAGLNAIAWGSLGALLLGMLTTRSYWSRDIPDIKDTWKLNWGFGRWVLGGTLAGKDLEAHLHLCWNSHLWPFGTGCHLSYPTLKTVIR